MAIVVQILLIAVISCLTILLSALGIQVFQIFLEFRLTLKKVNRILDRTESLSETATRPIAAVNNFFTDVKALVKDTQNEIVDSLPDKVIPASETKSEQFPKRFFHRSGIPLHPS